MYINELKLKLLKIRNGILLCIGSIGLVIFGLSAIAKFLELGEEYNYVIIMFILTFISVLAIYFSVFSRKTIGNIYFLSRYFEGSLDDKVKFSEIAKVTNIKEKKIKSMVKRFLRKNIMKNYTIDEYNNEIILFSKKYQCECKNCGASIVGAIDEVYKCSYCGRKIFNVIEKK